MDLNSSKTLLRSIERRRNVLSVISDPSITSKTTAVVTPTIRTNMSSDDCNDIAASTLDKNRVATIDRLNISQCVFAGHSSSAGEEGSNVTEAETEICSCLEELLEPKDKMGNKLDWEYDALVVLVLKESFSGNSHFVQSSTLLSFAKSHIVNDFIGHDEPRVRKLTADLIGVLAGKLGPSYFEELGPILFSLVRAFFQRRDVSRETQLGGVSEIALDDTTGWYALESILCSYRELVSGCGKTLDYLQRASETELNLLIRDSAGHMNRYIRQATFEFIHALMVQYDPGSLSWDDGEYVHMLCHCIASGLSDDFSQVRFPATFAARYFLLAINDCDRDAHIWAELLPRICLNRHYPADGVKNASLDMWGVVTEGKGRELVTKHVRVAYEHYASMVDNKSHLICEAACWVLGELGSIISADAVVPYLAGILNLLGVALGDDSWQVRGAACVATGRMTRAHPDETCSTVCDTFLPLWITHLNDHIWALRSDSATAIGIAMRSPIHQLSSAAIDAAVTYLAINLAAGAKQKKKFSFIPENSSLFSFIKKEPESAKLLVGTPLSSPPLITLTARASANAEINQRFGVIELRRRPGNLLDYLKQIFGYLIC